MPHKHLISVTCVAAKTKKFRRNCVFKMGINNVILSQLVLAVFLHNGANACDHKFEGFGVFLGSNSHFSRSPPGIEAKVLGVVYDFLGIRLFRTSIEDNFSPEPDKYEINCTETDGFTCSWINVHKYISTLPDVKVFASIWSPPHYMKNQFYQLLPEYETAYYHFIKNVTELIQRDYNIALEKVSPVNEPENVFAAWDHTNMTPDQLCRIIRAYNDPLISICPENSYYWVSKLFYNFESGDSALNCSFYCDIKATHGYSLNLDFFSINSLLAYYDLQETNLPVTNNPIWLTEVSSTYHNADENQMTEALDLATSILNFLGTTCVQRYYFWYAYTKGSSGESLIWGDDNGNLIFPKKFFVYKMFVNASNTLGGPVEVNKCNVGRNQLPPLRLVENLGCLQFGDEDRVLINKDPEVKQLNEDECRLLCCTTEDDDISCTSSSQETNIIPARSVCQCVLNVPDPIVRSNDSSIVLE